jgi:hypothetical protein
MTAVFCIMATMTACASKSRRNVTLETDAQSAETTATEQETESAAAATEEETEEGTLQFDEELDTDLVGTWKYSYDEDLYAYYVIDPDHSMMSMIDLSDLMFIKNGKLVLGEDDPSYTFSFKQKGDHLVAKVEKKVILDILPKSSADTEEVQGDFDLYESAVLPQEETQPAETDEDGEEIEAPRKILRFLDDKTYLIELGVCYSNEGQLIFLTNEKRLVMDYWFDDDDKDTLIVKDAEGDEIHLTRSDDLNNAEDEDED